MTELERALLGIYTTRCSGGNGAGLDRILPAGRTRFYAYGRQALAEALRRAGVSAGDRVLMPGLIGRGVLASVEAVGARPVFYAVDESLGVDAKSLEQVRGHDIRAAVAVNYFGFPQTLAPLRDWCCAHGALLIEDNAHGFLSSDGEVPLGRRGDMGVFSLFKTVSLPNGAALVDNRSGTSDVTGLAYSGSPCAAQWRHRMKTLVKRQMELGNLKSAQATLGAVRAIQGLASGWRSSETEEARRDILPQEAFAPQSTRLLRLVDIPQESYRRQSLYKWCLQLLDAVPGVYPLQVRLGAGVVPQGFPFLYSGDAAAFIREWWRRGIQIVPWPDRLPAGIGDSVPQYYQRILLVPFLW